MAGYGGYGGYNFGAPSYPQQMGQWPGQQHGPAPIQQNFGGQPQYGQAQMFQPQQYGGYAGFHQQNYQPPQASRPANTQGALQVSRPANNQGAPPPKVNIPAGATYNGRAINSSNATSVFNNNTAKPTPLRSPVQTQASNYANYTAQGNGSYSQQSYAGPPQNKPQPKPTQNTPVRKVAVVQRQAPPPPQPVLVQRPRQSPPQQQQHHQQQQQQQQAPNPRAHMPQSYAPPERERPMYQPERHEGPTMDAQRTDTRAASASAQSASAAAAAAAVAASSSYSTGIKLREVRGLGLQVVRLTAGSSAMLTGQITEDDVLLRINEYKIPAYGYNVAEIRNLLAGARGSRIQLGFQRQFGHHQYDVDLVRNVRSSKKASSAAAQRASRPASWQISSDPHAAPPVYEGFVGGSLAGGSVVDADSFTPSIAIGDVAGGEDM